MYHFIRAKLTYFDNRELNLKKLLITSLFTSQERISFDSIRLRQIRRKLKEDQTKTLFRNLIVEINTLQLPIQNESDERQEQTFYGPKLITQITFYLFPYMTLIKDFCQLCKNKIS
ncbi:hypothetical protein pb186bvf_002412 [Paramecium bursaria]